MHKELKSSNKNLYQIQIWNPYPVNNTFNSENSFTRTSHIRSNSEKKSKKNNHTKFGTKCGRLLLLLRQRKMEKKELKSTKNRAV